MEREEMTVTMVLLCIQLHISGNFLPNSVRIDQEFLKLNGEIEMVMQADLLSLISLGN